jgi:Ca-activated chloride channel family protein
MQVRIKTDRSEVFFGENSKVNMMVELAAPATDQEKRNPLSICAVLDRSGSMSGDKIEQLKQSMYRLIDHMTESDSLALVFFDDRVDAEEFRQMDSSSKEVMRAKVASLSGRGSTDIGSALKRAALMFKSHEGAAGGVERIMLLTDGDANMGAVKMEDFAPIVGDVRDGVTLSCFGYGIGFNENLLQGLSKSGKGGNYFIENPDSVAKVFAVELGGLLSCYAQQIGLSVKPHAGVKVVDVLNDMEVKTSEKDGVQVTAVDVGDMFCGEKRKVLIRLECEKRDQALPRPQTVADICVLYSPLREGSFLKKEEKIKVQFVKAKEEATQSPDKEVAEQVAILEAANAQAKAKELADRGDYNGANVVWHGAIDNLRSMGLEGASHYAAGMESMAGEFSAANYSTGGHLAKSMAFCSTSALRGRTSDSIGYTSALSGDMSDLNAQTRSLVDKFTAKASTGELDGNGNNVGGK